MPALVSNTDKEWFDFLSGLAQSSGAASPVRWQLDEVNFWRPRDQQAVKAIQAGDPFFLRLKRPHHKIAGWGYFAHWRLVPFALAWELFGQKNGAPDFELFRRNVWRLRGEDPAAVGALPLGCVVLRDVTFLPPGQWIDWGVAEEWSREIVNDKSYDPAAGAGRRLASLLVTAASEPPPDLAEAFEPLAVDTRLWRQRQVATRDAQGTFRLRLLDAYGNRCALTGERVVPVLEAAHIQSYLGPASNHVQNGLLLKADLHKLYDAGYVDITPDYRFRVSDRVFNEYANGKDYYALAGCELRRPADERAWPSRDALAWHGEYLYQ